MTRSRKFIWLCLSFLAGVLSASAFFVPGVLAFWGVGLMAAAMAVCVFLRQSFLFFICLCAALFFAGILRINQSFVPSQFSEILNSRAQLEGFVVEDPDIRQDRQYLTVRPKNFSQNILVTEGLSQEFFYGDLVAIDGKFAEAKNFSDFDYVGYLRMHNVYALSNRPKILILKSHQLSFLKEFILKIKWAFSARINRLLPDPQSSLLLGILIGAKKSLPTDLSDAFSRVGLTHIVAVSGFNISIIVKALEYSAWVIGRRWAFWLTNFLIAAFVVLTGATASVIRAAIMGFLLLLSWRAGRLYSISAALCATAAVMVFLNPQILFWDAGFQLSFLATAGIVYGVPVLEKLSKWWTKVLWLRGLVFTTLSAIIATLPLLLFDFGSLSLVALLANLLVLPLVPPVMLLGFLGIMPFLGPGLAFVAGLLLSYIIFVVRYLSALKFASLSISISPLTFVILYGFILVMFIWLKTATVERNTQR